MKKNVENKTNKVFASNSDSSKPDSDDYMRQQRKTDATELALKKSLWFRLLLAIPELSITWMPDFMGLFCYLLLPTIIILCHLVTFLYVIFLVPFPQVYLAIMGILFPLILFSASAKAHAFWNYWQLQIGKRFVWDTDKALTEYIALIKKAKKKQPPFF